VHHYSAPDYPIRYGGEIDALRRACAEVKDSPFNPEAGSNLLRIAAAVMTFQDAPPNTAQRSAHQRKMNELVRLIQAELSEDEVSAVPAIVQNVIVETGYSKRAAEKLKVMLPKLRKSSYDIVIKIISDIGSATVKKILGL
jgi:Uncharacterized protein conserved in bacteria (DUF2321)